MREAKARRRMERGAAPEMTECGRVTFEGPLFGGAHTVRLLARSDARVIEIEVDGAVTCSKTPRGARALLMRRICAVADVRGGRRK